MRQPSPPTQCRRPRRGSSLVITLVMLTVITLGLLWSTDTVMSQERLGQRKHSLSRAYYAAEAGVAQVLHWGNFPEDYTLDTSLFEASGSDYPALEAAVSGNGYTITGADLASLGVGELRSQHDYDVAEIVEIELLGPDAGDPVSCLFKVRSVGRSADGIERTVLAYLDVNPITGGPSVALPAALISFNTAGAKGNARIHWGESWAKNTFDMLNKSQMKYLDPGRSDHDPWAIYRSEANIDFPSNWKWGKNKDLYDPDREQPGLAPASGDYADAFFQYQPEGALAWPEFDYDAFKDHAMANGRYYSTDSAGNIYRDGIEDAAHRVDFKTEFELDDRESAPFDFIFIDTIDGQPPAEDDSNLASIRFSGNSEGLKGVFWIGANFKVSGVGNPPSLVGTDPDGNMESLKKIFFHGVLYAAGTLEMTGNAGVYGSVVTQRGFTGSGTPDIYYDAALADGIPIDNGNAGSAFRVVCTTSH